MNYDNLCISLVNFVLVGRKCGDLLLGFAELCVIWNIYTHGMMQGNVMIYCYFVEFCVSYLEYQCIVLCDSPRVNNTVCFNLS